MRWRFCVAIFLQVRMLRHGRVPIPVGGFFSHVLTVKRLRESRWKSFDRMTRRFGHKSKFHGFWSQKRRSATRSCVTGGRGHGTGCLCSQGRYARAAAREPNQCPSGKEHPARQSFQSGNEDFGPMSRRSSVCAEATWWSPHKQTCRSTPRLAQKTISR